MKYLLSIFVIIVSTLNTAHTQSSDFPPDILEKYSLSLLIWSRGNEGGGGGDPQAIEFLRIGDQIAENMKRDLHSPRGKEFQRHITLLRQSLDSPDVLPLLRFQDAPVICNGNPKIACTYYKTEEVIIYRNGWNALLPSQKSQVVMLEIFQLMKLTDRYSLSQEVTEILAIKKCETSIKTFFSRKFGISNVSPTYIVTTTEKFTVQQVNYRDSSHTYYYEIITANDSCSIVGASQVSKKELGHKN